MLDLWPSLKLEGWDIDAIVSDTHARCASSEVCIFHKYLLRKLSFLVVMVFLILTTFLNYKINILYQFLCCMNANMNISALNR